MVILTALIVLALYGLNRGADVLIARQRAKYVIQRPARSTASRPPARRPQSAPDDLYNVAEASAAYAAALIKAARAEQDPCKRAKMQLQAAKLSAQASKLADTADIIQDSAPRA